MQYDRKIYEKRRDNKIKEKTGFSRSTVKRYGENTLKELKNDWKCSKCEETSDLTIHHKDRNGINKAKIGEKMNNNIENLEVMCRKCHGGLHNRDRIK
jgi:5-methylcytosine-specific restriction endonuclease McrA